MTQGPEEHHVSFLWEQKGTHLHIWLNKEHVHTGNREQGNTLCGKREHPLWEKGTSFTLCGKKGTLPYICSHVYAHIKIAFFIFSLSCPSTSAQSCSSIITGASTCPSHNSTHSPHRIYRMLPIIECVIAL